MTTRFAVIGTFFLLLFGGGLLAQPHIASISPASVYVESGACTLVSFEIDGSGFAAGQTLVGPYGTIILAEGTSSTKIGFVAAIPPSCNWDSRSLPFSIVDGNGKSSNSKVVAVRGPVNTLTRMADGTFASISVSGTISTFSAQGTFMQTMKTFKNAFGIASSEAGSLFVSVSQGQQGSVDVYMHGAPVGSVDSNASFKAVTSKNNVGVSLQSDARLMTVFDAGSASPPPTSVDAGIAPWTVTMLNASGGVIASVYDRLGVSFSTFSVTGSSATLKNSIDLSKVMARADQFGSSSGSSSPAVQTAGGWFSTGFSSGKSAGVVSVMGPYTNADGSVGTRIASVDSVKGTTLGYVDLSTTQNLVAVTFASSELPGRSLDPGIVADGELVVALFDTQAGITRFTTVNPRTGQTRMLEETSKVFPAGLMVIDGNVYVACQNQMDVIRASVHGIGHTHER